MVCQTSFFIHLEALSKIVFMQMYIHLDVYRQSGVVKQNLRKDVSQTECAHYDYMLSTDVFQRLLSRVPEPVSVY